MLFFFVPVLYLNKLELGKGIRKGRYRKFRKKKRELFLNQSLSLKLLFPVALDGLFVCVFAVGPFRNF